MYLLLPSAMNPTISSSLIPSVKLFLIYSTILTIHPSINPIHSSIIYITVHIDVYHIITRKFHFIPHGFKESLLNFPSLWSNTYHALFSHHRTLNLQTPLYIGGLPSFLLPLTNQTILTRFTGCLADVKINHKLIDFAHVSHVGNLIPGCSPKKGCESGCSGCDDGECVCLWNGTTCNKDNDVLSFNEHSYFMLEPVELQQMQQMQTLSLQFRTLQSYALLMQLGDEATIEVWSYVITHTNCSSGHITFAWRCSQYRDQTICLLQEVHIKEHISKVCARKKEHFKFQIFKFTITNHVTYIHFIGYCIL